MTEQKSNVASCRLNTDQMRKLDAAATEKGLPRSMMIKHIILEYLDRDIQHVNLLQASIMNVNAEIQKNSRKTEFFMQLFYSWLVNWFASNPRPTDVSETFIKDSIARRDTFAKNFTDEIYNETTELFESLFADNIEHQKEEEENND